jgi:hypothetical protein
MSAWCSYLPIRLVSASSLCLLFSWVRLWEKASAQSAVNVLMIGIVFLGVLFDHTE